MWQVSKGTCLVEYLSLLNKFLGTQFSFSIFHSKEEDKRRRGVEAVERKSEERLWVTMKPSGQVECIPKGKEKENPGRGKCLK